MAITRTPIVDDDGTGTTGTVLDNTWKQELYNQIDASTAAIAPVVSLVGHGSGSDTSAAAASFSGYVGGPGLQPTDTLTIEIELEWTAPLSLINLLWAQTNAAILLPLSTFGLVTASDLGTRVHVDLRRYPVNDAALFLRANGGYGAPATKMQAVTIDGWSKSWALVMQHNGVPAGKVLNWKWSILKTAA
jgi:hypothetical protein